MHVTYYRLYSHEIFGETCIYPGLDLISCTSECSLAAPVEWNSKITRSRIDRHQKKKKKKTKDAKGAVDIHGSSIKRTDDRVMPSIQHLNSSYKIYVSIYSFYQHNLLFNNAMTSEQYPTAVSGGCLCGCVRYRVTFPSSHDWRRGVIIMYPSNLHMLTCLPLWHVPVLPMP